tara:strand:- start:95243 stop:95974 length:732 start_codon:yes stop_codon:yes gene_type:complete
MQLSDYKALTFDCYGTLIDWEAGILSSLSDLASRASRSLSKDEILEAHARHESAQQAQTPTMLYRNLLPIVYKRIAEEWGVSVTHDECETHGKSVGAWPAFPDSVGALQYLKKYYKLIVLSNVDNQTFVLSNERLGVEFDAIYSAEDVGSYKPSDRNFEYMLDHVGDLGLEKSDLLHTAESLFHDHKAANRHGIANCWIHRRYQKEGFGATMPPGEMPSCDFRFTSMADLVKAHQECLRREVK